MSVRNGLLAQQGDVLIYTLVQFVSKFLKFICVAGWENTWDDDFLTANDLFLPIIFFDTSAVRKQDYLLSKMFLLWLFSNLDLAVCLQRFRFKEPVKQKQSLLAQCGD